MKNYTTLTNVQMNKTAKKLDVLNVSINQVTLMLNHWNVLLVRKLIQSEKYVLIMSHI